MVTAPNHTIEVPDDTDFLRAALSSYLNEAGIPDGTEFHQLPTSDQSAVLRKAQALKLAQLSSVGAHTPTAARTVRGNAANVRVRAQCSKRRPSMPDPTPTRAEHTPGPWVAKAWTYHSLTTVTTGYRDQKVIADCAPGPVSGYLDSEAEANAQLIAAAPDMLEALKEFVAYAECHCAEPDCQPCAYCMAEAAIKKAEGVYA